MNEHNVGIPIYRAKNIDSDEWVEGDLVLFVSSPTSTKYLIRGRSGYSSLMENRMRIDPNTLAIHFPNSSNTSSEQKRWYNMDEISNIIKEYEDGNMATN